MLEQVRSALADDPPVVLVLTFVSMWLAAAIGAWLARKRVFALEGREVALVVETAILTLLALIIGFTFSMALTRYDQRKNLEEEEANAVGTAWVRADLLPAADAARLRTALKEYLEQRIVYYEARGPAEAARSEARTSALQSALWAAVAAPANAQPNPVNALAVSGINDVLNSQGYTQAAWLNRIPFAAWALLAALALFCSVFVGFEVERAQAGRVVPFVLPIAVSIACCLIADLESPRYGLIHVQPQNLLILAQSIRGS
jgi:hypothetical protein